MPILETEDLTHIFPEGTVAIQDISLKINEGEFVVIAGANGSGKRFSPGTLTAYSNPQKEECCSMENR